MINEPFIPQDQRWICTTVRKNQLLCAS